MKKLGLVPDPNDRPLAEERRVVVERDADIVTARQEARALAGQLGFSPGDATIIATAISELARNIVHYAGRGSIILRSIENGKRRGLVVIADDDGPGIGDIGLAMRDGYSTAGRLGLGLPGVRRLMDEFKIVSELGGGTRVAVKKWTNKHP